MFTSRTSVGVQERSASSSTVFVSEDMLCCCAWRRLDSRRDSICSWQARKQSCRGVQWKGGRERERETQESFRKITSQNTGFLTKQGKCHQVIWESSRLERRVGKAEAPDSERTGWASLLFCRLYLTLLLLCLCSLQLPTSPLPTAVMISTFTPGTLQQQSLPEAMLASSDFLPKAKFPW